MSVLRARRLRSFSTYVLLGLAGVALPLRAQTLSPNEGVVLLDSNFSSGWQGWTKLDQSSTPSPKAVFNWNSDPLVVTGNGFMNGALWFTNPASLGSYATGKREYDWVSSPPFTLVGKGNLASYVTFERTEGTTATWDRRKVYVEIDGVRNLLAQSRYQTSPDDDGNLWTKRIWLGLDAWSSSTPKAARLVFEMDTVDGFDNNHEGWIIDQVRVTRQDIPIVDWQSVSGVVGPPALGRENTGRVQLVAVDTNGVLRSTNTDLSQDFSSASSLGYDATKGVYLTFKKAMAPVLVNVGANLALFAVSENGILCRWDKVPGMPWGPMTQVTPEGGVIGRPSVAVTQGTGSPAPIEVHVVFKQQTPSGTYARYLRLQGSTVQASTNLMIAGAASPLQPTIASDKVDRVALVLQFDDQRVHLYELLRSQGWTIQYKGTGLDKAAAPASVVYQEGGAFAHYGRSTDFGITSMHLTKNGTVVTESLTMDGNSSLWTTARTLTEPRSTVYHGCLIVAYRDPQNAVRYIRREKAASLASPGFRSYQDGKVIGEEGYHPIATASAAPALMETGGELYVAVRGGGLTNGTTAYGNSAGATYWVCLSRSVFKARLAMLTCGVKYYADANDYDDFPAYPAIGMEIHRLPVFTRIGKATWDMPEWLVTKFFLEYNQKAGGPAPGTKSGKTSPMQALITSLGTRANYAPDGFRIDPNASTFTCWEELGHYLYDAAIEADNPSHVNIFMASEVQAAQGLILANPQSMPWTSAAQTRRRGFLGTYETEPPDTSAAHQWIYYAIPYLYQGATYRQAAAADSAAGFNLLQQKYDWVRNTIWGGMEFNDSGEVVP